jgi:hypothetical protein
LVVPASDAKLRFWRHTNLLVPGGKAYRSPQGVLGYEVDGFVDDLFRPPGLIMLSHTLLHVEKALVQDYGAAYRGSGTVTHRLTMYRHHQQLVAVVARNKTTTTTITTRRQVCKDQQPIPYVNSSLVFSTGTIQWSWALSQFRDGDAMEEDFNLQQATINVLADMEVFPSRLITTVSRLRKTSPLTTSKHHVKQPERLQFAHPSVDRSPPTSTINSCRLFLNKTLINTQQQILVAHHALPHLTLKITGIAKDAGDGKVASIEVSVNGGKTWQVAHGREHWSFSHSFQMKPKSNLGFHQYHQSHEYPVFDVDDELHVFREGLIKQSILYDEHQPQLIGKTGAIFHLMVIVRAVDDSGWIERTSGHNEHLLCKLNNGIVCNGNCSVPRNIRMLHFSVV